MSVEGVRKSFKSPEEEPQNQPDSLPSNARGILIKQKNRKKADLSAKGCYRNTYDRNHGLGRSSFALKSSPAENKKQHVGLCFCLGETFIEESFCFELFYLDLPKKPRKK